MLKNVSEIRKNNKWNVFEPNQIYESYRVVENIISNRKKFIKHDNFWISILLKFLHTKKLTWYNNNCNV